MSARKNFYIYRSWRFLACYFILLCFDIINYCIDCNINEMTIGNSGFKLALCDISTFLKKIKSSHVIPLFVETLLIACHVTFVRYPKHKPRDVRETTWYFHRAHYPRWTSGDELHRRKIGFLSWRYVWVTCASFLLVSIVWIPPIITTQLTRVRSDCFVHLLD